RSSYAAPPRDPATARSLTYGAHGRASDVRSRVGAASGRRMVPTRFWVSELTVKSPTLPKPWRNSPRLMVVRHGPADGSVVVPRRSLHHSNICSNRRELYAVGP